MFGCINHELVDQVYETDSESYGITGREPSLHVDGISKRTGA